MRADVIGHHQVALNLEYRAQIPFDVHRINRSTVKRGKRVKFVRTQARIERVLFENLPGAARGLLLART